MNRQPLGKIFHFVLLIVAASSLSLALAAKGDSAASAGRSSAQAQDAADVAISNFAFSPKELRIGAGTTVTWTNQDDFAHTSTSDDPNAWDSGPIDSKQTFQRTFSKPGSYAYHCSIHRSMKAKIIVE